MNKDKKQDNIDVYADAMLDKIVACVKTELTRNSPRIESAIVTGINEDGTVDVELPSDEGSGFSRILNQSGFELKIGDAVEILLKNGSFNNCWITAKHQATVPVKTQLDEGMIEGQDYTNNSDLNNVNANSILTEGSYVVGSGVSGLPDNSSGSVLHVAGNGRIAF